MAVKRGSQSLAHFISLLQDGEWHDGDSVGQSLGLTRAAVWKMAKKLKNYGVALESVKGRGYHLAQSLVLLDRQAIQASLPTPLQPQVQIETFESIGSTNTYLKRDDFPASSGGFNVCLAELQTQGRGRFARHWYSPFGSNLLMSLRYTFSSDVCKLAGLSQVVALVIAQVLSDMGIDGVHIKWPNDVVVAGSKLSGCLVELSGEANGQATAIIGMGINCNMPHDADQHLERAWTSVADLVGHYCNRNLMAAKLLTALIEAIRAFEDQGLEAFLPLWQKFDSLRDRQVSVTHNGTQLDGIARGIDGYGQLLLEVGGSSVVTPLSSGDTTLKPPERQQ